MLNAEQGRLLIAHARAAIEGQLGLAEDTPFPRPAWLDKPGAVFVTLTCNDELRGCIGSLEAHRSLIEDLRANALGAAFRDPRFPPVTGSEWPEIRVEVSVLAPAQPLPCNDEADACRQLRPGQDGVILEYGWHRATFLPQVWEQLPEPRAFLAHLKHKASLAPDFWAEDLRLWRYSVEKFRQE